MTKRGKYDEDGQKALKKLAALLEVKVMARTVSDNFRPSPGRDQYTWHGNMNMIEDLLAALDAFDNVE